MCRTYERGTKARLSFSGRPHAPVNMANSIEDVNVGEKNNTGNGTFAVLCYISCRSFCKSSKFFGTSIASLDPETVELPAFYIVYPPCLQERVPHQRS